MQSLQSCFVCSNVVKYDRGLRLPSLSTLKTIYVLYTISLLCGRYKSVTLFSITLFLRHHHHSIGFKLLELYLQRFEQDGLILRPSSRVIKITTLGLLALQEIEQELNQTTFKFRRSDTGKIKPVKKQAYPLLCRRFPCVVAFLIGLYLLYFTYQAQKSRKRLNLRLIAFIWFYFILLFSCML